MLLKDQDFGEDFATIKSGVTPYEADTFINQDAGLISRIVI